MNETNLPPASNPRLQALILELSILRPDLSKEKIEELIREKKKKVGGGFLTDQGALFLIASELGVRLGTTERTLSTIKAGEKNLSLVARILAIGPPKLVTKTSDTASSFVMKIIVFDSTSSLSINIWSHKVASDFLRAGVSPGDLVRFSSLNARVWGSANLVTLSATEDTKIEKISESVVNKIPSLDNLPKRLDEAIRSRQGYSIVQGKINDSVRKVDYTRKSGEQGSFVSFSLGDPAGEPSQAVRVVLWQNSNPVFQKLALGDTVTLLNVKAIENQYLGNSQIELQGDETTLVLEQWSQSAVWLESTFSKITKEIERNQSNSRQVSATPFIARVMSIGQRIDQERTAHAYVLDSSGRSISLTANSGAESDFEKLKVDDVVVCKPDLFDGTRCTCSAPDSVSKVKAERKDIPNSSALLTEIERLEIGKVVTVDAMVMSDAMSREIQTKEGLVRRSELLLADPSGEIKLYGWRTLSRHLEKLPKGLRVLVRAVEVQSHEERKFLLLKNYSCIEPVG
ncbi:MAG: hypothetical protein ACYCQJ_11190 [Nitrososphaerales archaeon]